MPKKQSTFNYHYDEDQQTFQLYDRDLLIVELPYADWMNQQQCEDLADELWQDYLSVHKGEL